MGGLLLHLSNELVPVFFPLSYFYVCTRYRSLGKYVACSNSSKS